MIRVAGQFCDAVMAQPTWLPGQYDEQGIQPTRLAFAVTVDVSIEVKILPSGQNPCGWVANRAECLRYLTAIVDGCDCGGSE